ncbi:hypothetical protein [Nocardia sp. CA-135398]|uniref:hypothetical protein n=1 Tax=Nocardia sp. CA-135398 TaxID=3239977 RepID=UPI003D962ECA
MSAPTVEATMPAQAGQDLAQVTARSAPAPMPVLPVCTTPPVSTVATVRPSLEGLSKAELAQRLIAAHERAADLEERLAAATAALDAAEHQAAQLEDRNRELASDLDNALDQLAGHALHAEQERLIRTPAWSPWAASTDREGYDR